MTARRNRRAGVEDLWTKEQRDDDGTVRRVPSKLYGKGKRWRARYVDDAGNEHTKRFARKTDAQAWLDGQIAALVQGIHVSPRDAQRTVAEWCDEWVKGYGKRENTVALAKWHIRKIKAEFGDLPLAAVRPSAVKKWMVALKRQGHADSYIYSLHSRLSQILGDAVHDGLLARNPCSRRTSPQAGRQKVYVATTDQVWALYRAMPENVRVSILLGAFVGLRISEAAGLWVEDIDFAEGVVYPQRQWPERPLKTDASDTPVPIPPELVEMLRDSVKARAGRNVVCDELGKAASPWVIGWNLRQIKEQVPGLPSEFSFQDLRHYYASLLIRHGADIKTVQARVRHGSAITTLRYYAHLWPDADESTRNAVGGVLREHLESTAYPLRTEPDSTAPGDSEDKR
ncbi:tyrosine-type recombinase/integrase [Nocardia sp. bgisy118]|uniref:tyrosine-type recombinase/integrase n=1 Tax=Nocardia sp. bgisy118 TaxID=3413786 RepID=UPI003F49D2F9